MNPNDLVVFLWLLPVTLQIVIPIVVMCAWLVVKLPILFGMREARQSHRQTKVALAS